MRRTRLLSLLLAALLSLLLAGGSAPARADDPCNPTWSEFLEQLADALEAAQQAVDEAQAKEWRQALRDRVLSGDIDPTQALPTDAEHPYTPLTDRCKKALGKAVSKALTGSNLEAILSQVGQARSDYQDCLAAEFDGWFDANFPADKLDDLIDGDRTAMSTADRKLADLLYGFRYAQAAIPGGHEQTGPTCTLNSLAMLFDEKNGRHGSEDQASIVDRMSNTTSSVLLVFSADCWSGGNPGSWGGWASWQACVKNMLGGMNADYAVHDDWDDIVATVEGGTPVLVTYYIKGWSGNAQAVKRGTADSGYHASVLEGVFEVDGTRYVVVKNPWDGWPQIWTEAEFKESWDSAEDYGLSLN